MNEVALQNDTACFEVKQAKVKKTWEVATGTCLKSKQRTRGRERYMNTCWSIRLSMCFTFDCIHQLEGEVCLFVRFP